MTLGDEEQVLAALAGSMTLRTASGLTRAVEEHIRAGTVPPGSRLPTIRAVAEELGMSRSTVGQAWRELAAQGLVESRRRGGTVVLEERLPPHAHRFESMIRTTSRTPVDLGNIGWQDVPRAPLEAAFTAALANPAINTTMPAQIAPELAAAVRRWWPVQSPQLLAMHGMTDTLDTALTAFVRPGDRVVVESPTIARTFDILHALRAIPIPVSYGPDGPDRRQLEHAMNSDPAAFIYQPAASLPTGRSVSAEWVADVAPLLRGSMPVIEIGQSSLMSPAHHSLATLLPDQVLHAQGYNFFFGSDMRLAVVGGSDELVTTLAMRLSFSTRYVSRIMQLALAFLLTDGASLQYVRDLSGEIRRRHAAFAEQLRGHGLEIEVGEPPYLWIPVPDETSVCSSLSADGIGVYPGAFFRADGAHAHDPRISLNAAALGSGIEELASRVAEACKPPTLPGRVLH